MLTFAQSIKQFSSQFTFEPTIENKDRLQPFIRSTVVGMGGSGLSTLFLKDWKPEIQLTLHQDYSLPHVASADRSEMLYIFSSYSGNTEEVLAAFHEAREKSLNLAIITAGGQLLEKAREFGIPYILLPQDGIQPRVAVGYSLLALVAFVSPDSLMELHGVSQALAAYNYDKEAQKLATTIDKKIPILYSSLSNRSLAYYWKITINETSKMPAFMNAFSELNHNEMAGFDINSFAELFHIIILEDNNDPDHTVKRRDILAKILRERSYTIDAVMMAGENRISKLMGGIMLANQTALALAELHGHDPDSSSMIEEFKKQL